MVELVLSYETSFTVSYEVENILNLRAHGDFLFHTGKEVVQLARTLQNYLVSHVDVVDKVAVEAPTTQSDGIQSAEGSRVTGHEAEGQNRVPPPTIV